MRDLHANYDQRADALRPATVCLTDKQSIGTGANEMAHELRIGITRLGYRQITLSTRLFIEV